jgi:uncharacterized cupredoxin-like copper-binding protein
MKKIWVATLGLAAVAVLAWTLPASAKKSAPKTAQVTTVKVTAGKPSEFAFTVVPKRVVHGTVIFTVTNGGALPHDFKIGGKKTILLSPGVTKKLTVTFAKAGNYPYLCTVTGHAAAGMKGTLKVT